MYGLLLRSVQAYTRATHGAVLWARVLRSVDHPADGFEPMLSYPQDTLDRVLAACSAELDRPSDTILEDVGTFLVTNPRHQALRRLLRFGGSSFVEFLQSLEELPDRARLALQEVAFPRIDVAEIGPAHYRLHFDCQVPAIFPVALGAVRAMADDYGALVLIDAERSAGPKCESGTLHVTVLEVSHSLGRRFVLASERLGIGH